MAPPNQKPAKLIIPAMATRIERVVDKSRFIADAGPAFSVEEAREFIGRIRSEFPDASHHVPAFIIGHGAGVTMHCSDDGEPSGTAGRPALAVLQGSGFGDIVCVVTRYFGGIKLGTGGLVRAYSDAMRDVLAALPRAEKVATTRLMLAIEYSLLERVRLTAQEFGGVIYEEEFATDVTLSIRFRDEKVSGFLARLNDMTRGKTNAIIIGKDADTIMPLEDNQGTNS